MKNFTIVPITEGNMLDDIVELHLDAFAGYLNTLLGPGYIKAFVTWFIKNKGTIAIAAIDENQKVIGYALCAPVGYSVRLNRDLFWGAAVQMFKRPWLFFNARVRFVLVERIKVILGQRENVRQTLKLPEPSMSLVAIGVASTQRRSRIGQRLMHAVEGNARDLRMRSLVLSVYEDAKGARSFYEQYGWRLYPTATKNGDILKYWRLLDDAQGVFSR